MSARIGTDLDGYYRLHAPIYDLTRPWFLFGRRRLLREASTGLIAPNPRILEVGCGTGSNLAWLRQRLPQAQLCGLDLAPAMLERARARLGDQALLLQHALGTEPLPPGLSPGFDLIVMSYMLSMTGPGKTTCINAAAALLAPGGRLAVVDFWSTPSAGFARWMGRNHVSFDPQLEQQLESTGLQRMVFRSSRAYGGWWRYGHWIGRRV